MRSCASDPEYLSAIGDEPAVFARGLGRSHGEWAVTEALGIDSRPRAKHLVEQLIELQRVDLQEPNERNFEQARFIYLALSSMCPPRGTPTPQSMVDDLSVNGLRTQFAATKNRPGLIRTSSGWHAPPKSFPGASFSQGVVRLSPPPAGLARYGGRSASTLQRWKPVSMSSRKLLGSRTARKNAVYWPRPTAT